MDPTSSPVAETWDLEPLYAGERAFASEVERFEREALGAIDGFRGRLGESAQLLADALDLLAELRKWFHRLHTYASLLADADLRAPERQAARQRVELLGSELAKRAAWVRPEIVALDEERLREFIAFEPRLAAHAFFLSDVLRLRDHVLGPEEERLVAETGPLRRGPGALYQLLVHAELPRPELSLGDGTQLTLTPTAFQQHRSSATRADRRRLFPAYFAAYSSFRGTLGQNLYTELRSHVFTARARRYASCLAAALAADNVPESVYRNLIAQVRERLPALHRYLRLRARRLGLDKLEYSDLYCPLSRTPPRRYRGEEARALLERGLQPLGPAYVADLRRAWEERWIDWHPAPGKRAGAYATGWAYDVHPYVLLNFTGDYESVSTLAHEMGHAMHSWYSNASQPYPTADYSIFVAEVASTFNEALLLGAMLELAADDEERVFLLGTHLDGLRGTLFRQAMFAEFELAIHERVERGEALTGAHLDAIYLELLRDYHGHAEGVVEIDERYAIEWAAIPHFYFDFYVYQYATGIVAATALARAVTERRPGARERYLEFLGSGGSDHPLALLRRAGVDLERREPFDEAFAALTRNIELLESIVARSESRAR